MLHYDFLYMCFVSGVASHRIPHVETSNMYNSKNTQQTGARKKSPLRKKTYYQNVCRAVAWMLHCTTEQPPTDHPKYMNFQPSTVTNVCVHTQHTHTLFKHNTHVFLNRRWVPQKMDCCDSEDDNIKSSQSQMRNKV